MIVAMLTVTVATAELTAELQAPLTTTLYPPASAAAAAEISYVLLVASTISTPSLRHWYVKSPLPLAPTERSTTWPSQTATLAGSLVIAAGKFTVSVATAEVVLPHMPLTATS